MIRNISLYIKDILQNMRDAGEFIQDARKPFGKLKALALGRNIAAPSP